MSVSRDTIAKVNGVTEDKVKCKNCSKHKDDECKWWAQTVEDDDFCSFWWGDVND